MKSRIGKIIKKIKQYFHTKKAMRIVKEYHEPFHVNNKSIFTPNTKLGRNTHFNGIHIIGRGNVTIGNNFHSGQEIMIITENHNYEGTKIPYDSSKIIKDVIIEDNVWLGNRVLILGGVKIGEGAIIQAGSVVVKDVPKYAIAGGSPAKVFSSRDSNHYEMLKEKEMFH